MARGRFITNEITRDKRINNLSDDTSRLAFTWLVTFADCEGRTYGDPAILRSMLFPRRQDITIEKMSEYVSEWSNSGLVVWYKANEDLYIWFPAFEKNQSGLRKSREAQSIIPQPSGVCPSQDADELQSNSGVTPDEIPVKLIKGKLIKDNMGAKEPAPKETSPQDLAYYRLQDYFIEFTGLPKPNPRNNGDWKEYNTLWKTPGKSILEWVGGDENKAQIIVEGAVNKMQKEHLTIASFKSIVKIASDEYSKRNGNGNGHQ